MHIAIVPSWWPSPEQPVSGVFFRDYARAYAMAGATVGVIFPDLVSLRLLGRGTGVPLFPRLSIEEGEGFREIRVRGVHTALGFPGLQMRRFRAWLSRGLAHYRSKFGEPDLLHAMCAIPAGWACTRLSDRLAERVVVTEHTGPFSLVQSPGAGRGYVRAALSEARAVVAVSEQSRQEMQTAGVAGEISVRGNCVSDVFRSGGGSGPRSSGAPRALFVGRLTEAKGVGDLIEAAVALKAECNLEWHFVGEGPLAPKIRERFASAGLGNFELLGLRDRSEVAGLMSESTFLVLPSHGETFGMVVAEALCMGLPVLTTRGTACADFVGKDDGVLVERRDVGSLTQGLRSMLERVDRFDREDIAHRAWSRFSGEALAAWYAELFRRVLGR